MFTAILDNVELVVTDEPNDDEVTVWALGTGDIIEVIDIDDADSRLSEWYRVDPWAMTTCDATLPNGERCNADASGTSTGEPYLTGMSRWPACSAHRE